jgi:glycosyltransferase involved in cell wall biosynthesis
MHMSDLPLVTIGLPFFNPGKYIVLAVKSIFAQTYTNWELIIIDDGSSDGSYDIVKNIDDKRVIIYRDGKNKGLAARLNEITEKARGEYIARMDADDIMSPYRLEQQCRILNSNQHVDAVTTGLVYLDKRGRVLGAKNGFSPSADEVFIRGGYLHASLLARKKWFLKFPYNENLRRAEDRDLFIRATLSGSNIFVLKEPLYMYRFIDNVRVSAWTQSYFEEVKIFLRYARETNNYFLYFLALRSLLKIVVLNGLSVFDGEQLLTIKKMKNLDTINNELIEQDLISVQRVFVPGLVV